MTAAAPPPDPAPPAPEPAPASDPWTEVLSAWALAVALVYASYRLLPETAAAFAAAAIWFAVPIGFHLRARRSLAAAGFTWRSVRRTLVLVLAYSAVFLPLYAIGFFAFLGREGWASPGIGIAAVAFVGNLFYAALPEEAFFRGFVQPVLGGGGGPARRFLRFVPLSRPIVIAAALFALTHVAFLPNPLSLAALERLTTFFPGLLFGALREETGDIVAPAFFHALCNAWLSALQRGFLQ